MKPAGKRAGVPWIGWHALRHTCCTLLVVEHGLNPKQLQAWLGHESAEFTLTVYTHLTGDSLPMVEWATPDSNVHPASTRAADADPASAAIGLVAADTG